MYILFISEKMLENLFNYASSFAMPPGDPRYRFKWMDRLKYTSEVIINTGVYILYKIHFFSPAAKCFIFSPP